MTKIQEKHIFYVLLILLLGYFTKMSTDIPQITGVVGDPGPGFIPFWFSLIAVFLLVYLLVSEVFYGRDETKNLSITKHEVISLSATISLVVLYLISLSVFGFVASTFIFLSIYKVLADKLINNIKPSIKGVGIAMIFSVLSTGTIYVIFGVLFKLSLP